MGNGVKEGGLTRAVKVKVGSPSAGGGFAKISRFSCEGVPLDTPNGPHLSAIDPGFVRFRSRPVTPEILSVQLQVEKKMRANLVCTQEKKDFFYHSTGRSSFIKATGGGSLKRFKSIRTEY